MFVCIDSFYSIIIGTEAECFANKSLTNGLNKPFDCCFLHLHEFDDVSCKPG